MLHKERETWTENGSNYVQCQYATYSERQVENKVPCTVPICNIQWKTSREQSSMYSANMLHGDKYRRKRLGSATMHLKEGQNNVRLYTVAMCWIQRHIYNKVRLHTELMCYIQRDTYRKRLGCLQNWWAAYRDIHTKRLGCVQSQCAAYRDTEKVRLCTEPIVLHTERDIHTKG